MEAFFQVEEDQPALGTKEHSKAFEEVQKNLILAGAAVLPQRDGFVGCIAGDGFLLVQPPGTQCHGLGCHRNGFLVHMCLKGLCCRDLSVTA